MSHLNNLSGKSILVTGGAGFIGSNIIEELLRHNNIVTCLDNFATGKKENIAAFRYNSDFKLIEGDIRDIDACKKAVEGNEIVLHQAALGSVPRSINDPKTTNDVNIGGFINVITAAKEAGIKRFVFASSSSVYGDSAELPKVEERIGKPLSPYAITKLVNEIYAKNFSELYGIETVGLRYFNVFGPKQDPNGPYAAVIPKFIKALSNGETPVIYGDGTQSRDFTFVENVVQANIQAATVQLNQKNNVVNIACGGRIDLNELFKIIKSSIVRIYPEAEKIVPEYGNARNGDIPHSHASIEKAKALLTYSPETDFEKNLGKTVSWYLK